MTKLHYIQYLFFVVAFATVFALAKNEPAIVVKWPADKPALKLSFEKFRREEPIGGQSTFTSDVTVENLTDRPIPRASFTLYFADKNKVRIGEGLLQVSDLEPRQTAKVEFKFTSFGIPASITLLAKKTIPLRVISVPPGAKLKVDGQEAGTTPVMVRLTVGTHQLDLTKEGYAPGNTPLDVNARRAAWRKHYGGIGRDFAGHRGTARRLRGAL